MLKRENVYTSNGKRQTWNRGLKSEVNVNILVLNVSIIFRWDNTLPSCSCLWLFFQVIENPSLSTSFGFALFVAISTMWYCISVEVPVKQYSCICQHWCWWEFPHPWDEALQNRLYSDSITSSVCFGILNFLKMLSWRCCFLQQSFVFLPLFRTN